MDRAKGTLARVTGKRAPHRLVQCANLSRLPTMAGTT